MFLGEGEIYERGYSMKRILLLAILFSTFLIGGTGCMLDNKPKQDVNDLALEYLEQKYGEKFEYAAPAGMSYTGTRTFLATCESFGDRRILVQITNFRDEENREILDNYITVKYEEEVRKFFKSAADDIFGSSKVFYDASGRVLSPDLPSDASLEEYYNCREGMINAVIALNESDYKDSEQIRLLSDKISNNFLCDELSILILVVDNDAFKSADESELREMCVTKSSLTYARLERYNGETKLDLQIDG